MINRKSLFRQGCAAALSLVGFVTNAPAVFEDGLPPTIEEAHAFLGGTFQRYQVAYGGAHASRASGAAAYGGDGCTSELVSDRRRRAMKVDWSAIAAVETSGKTTVELVSGRPNGDFRLYFPNERAARSAANAFEVLRSACVPPALTARR